MRNQLKNLAFPALIAITIVLVNFVVYYTSVCNSQVIQIRDIYGGVSSSSISSVKNRTKLISSLSGDNTTDIARLMAETETLLDYTAAVEYVEDNNSASLLRWENLSDEEQKAHAHKLYEECLKKYSVYKGSLTDKLSADVEDRNDVILYLKYVDEYHEYVADIANMADYMSDIAIYSDNQSISGNIVKTQKDFYGLSSITLTPVMEDGYLTFINYRLTDIFAILIAIISLASIKNDRKAHTRGLLASVVITVTATLAMHITNCILTDRFLGLLPFDTAVQSMEHFKTCPYMINAGALIVCTVLSKVVGSLIIMFAMTIIACTVGKKKIVISGFICAFALAELIFSLNETSTLLSEINILSFFSFERFFIRYLNLSIFNMAVSRLPIFIVFAAIMFVIMAIAAKRSISQHLSALTRQAEQEYYDEINRRYLESRKIRHDINNHLLAINTLIENGNIEQAKRYISEVSEQIDLAAMPIKTGRDVLDALLFKKTEQAANKGATILFEINYSLNDCRISDYDLCTIFGNILDNALDAVKSDDKIMVNVSNQHDILYISCKNPFEGELRHRGEKILTTKKDFFAHGFGLERIKETARRLGGDMNITTEDNVFYIEVLINL